MSDDPDRRAHERVGTVLSEKWALERLIGLGGMAAVYEARHRNGARAAVKVLHADLSRNPEVRERFLREGYAANRVEHPGVVKVLDDEVVTSGPDAGTAYIVMELLEGQSLQDRLESGPPVGEREFLSIADSVLEVLETAHARGVVHRDLKPENLFLLADDPSVGTGRARVKVLDFGLARLLQGQAITTYGLALGTPSFMSPEQAAGRIDEIDGRTDLFALAATGFRLRAGRRIHEGTNAVELVLKMANVAAPKLRSVAPTASEPFARIIDRALEFRREDRYASATVMRDDVRRAVAELDSQDTMVTLIASPAVVLPASRSEATVEVSRRDLETAAPSRAFVQPPPTEESIRLPRSRSLLPWLSLLLCGGIGAGLWWSSRARDSADGSAPAASAGPEGATSDLPVSRPGGDAGASPSPLLRAVATPSSPMQPPGAPGSPPPRRTTPADATPADPHKALGTRHPRPIDH